MKTLPLSEALKLATVGKLIYDKVLCELREVGTDISIVDLTGAMGGLGDTNAVAALLAHSMNIRDELIEALEKACALARASDDGYEAIDGIEQTEALEAVLAKARTVVMP